MSVPIIESVSPDSASVGEQVKIKGQNFKLAKIVTFSGVEAQFKSDSDQQITVTVPRIDSPSDSINIKVLNDDKKCSGKGKFKLIASSTPPLAAKPTPAATPTPQLATKPTPGATQTKVSETVPVTTPTRSISPATTNPRDLDRSRAAEAWKNIQSVKSQAYQAKYGSLARKMATLIQVNGLGQTLAFLKAKGKEHHNQMFAHLSEWVCSRTSGTGNLLDRILTIDSQSYRLATSEALAFLQWLKRFAEAELGSEEDN